MNIQNMKVRLYRDSSLVALCKVLYVDFLGMFIETNPLLYPKNTFMELEFEDNANRYGPTKKFPVIVTNRTTAGLGLKFIDIDKQREQYLLKVISVQQSQVLPVKKNVIAIGEGRNSY